jgi:predicted  nucleic acid-binding Zn-ribbon protein
MTTVVLTLVAETCCNCGTVFGINEAQLRQLRQSGAWFCCPNGHQQHYTETEADRLRKQLAATEKSRDSARAYARSVQDQNDAERRAHAATKGQLTKTRKRVANGVCPCCNRSFADLGRHMAGKHPDYAGQEGVDRG